VSLIRVEQVGCQQKKLPVARVEKKDNYRLSYICQRHAQSASGILFLLAKVLIWVPLGWAIF
jgi:hypothetical protein